MGCHASCSAETTSVVGEDQSPVGSIPGNIVASEKDDQMSEIMIDCGNLPNPHLFEPFSVLAMTPPITLLLPYI
jgi:hypothetical protein